MADIRICGDDRGGVCLMGKPTGFLDYKRIEPKKRAVEERLGDYDEVATPLKLDELADQGARCMDCGIPYCHALGCPVYNLIPEWNDAVYKGQYREAFRRLEMTNNLPEITGRICPAPCETSCTLSINDYPVTIKSIELAIAEQAFENGWIRPRRPDRETGKKVAIVGSGPAGLSAAQNLRRNGHSVTLFERADHLGGILRYGIPDFKLEKWIIDRRIQQLDQEGVQFETNVDIGEDISASYLQRKFDAILIAAGAGKPRELSVPGDGYEGIHFAMDYLTLSNKYVAGILPFEQVISARGKTVLVIGGGDTGSDCVGTANRQGAKKVYQFEIMPKPIQWEQPYNPEWPYWPNILRTSTSHEEGCERDWGIETVRFSGRGVHLEQAHFTRVEWRKEGGRMQKSVVPDSEFSLEIDLVLVAAGFEHVEHSPLLASLDIPFDRRGNISVDENNRTGADGVFAAGDCHTGASLVVRAISQGRQAAKAIHTYLM